MSTFNYPAAHTVSRIAGNCAALTLTLFAVNGYIHATEDPYYVHSVAFGFAFLALVVAVITRVITGVHTGNWDFRHSIFDLAGAAYLMPGLFFLTGTALHVAVAVMAFLVTNYLARRALTRAAAHTTGK